MVEDASCDVERNARMGCRWRGPRWPALPKRRLIRCCCAASGPQRSSPPWRLRLDRPAPRKLEIALTLAVLVGRGASGRRARRASRRLCGAIRRRRRFPRSQAGPRRRGRHGFRRDARERGQNPDDRRHRFDKLAAVLRRRRGASAARGRSARQAGERAQALPEPDRDRHRRAHALTASGRRTGTCARSPPTARRSTRCATAAMPICPSSWEKARMSG